MKTSMLLQWAFHGVLFDTYELDMNFNVVNVSVNNLYEFSHEPDLVASCLPTGSSAFFFLLNSAEL